MSEDRYDRTTITLHWIVAGLVLVVWLVGETLALKMWPKPHGRTVREIHVWIGTLLTVILVVRLFWRMTRGKRLPTPPSLIERAAKLVHYALYTLLLTIVSIGLFAVWNKGGEYLGGLFYIPPFGDADKVARKALSIQLIEYHELLANTVMVLAALHAGAALVHHYGLKDGVLRRMLPGGQS